MAGMVARAVSESHLLGVALTVLCKKVSRVPARPKHHKQLVRNQSYGKEKKSGELKVDAPHTTPPSRYTAAPRPPQLSGKKAMSGFSDVNKGILS
jgi:hypothetical protein